jgi:dTDP-4-dehydrorhamnose 3,5-epimerase
MPITVTPTKEIPDVLIIEPKLFGDARGWFYESFNQKEFTEKTGIQKLFVQDNHSYSTQYILRGLHYQMEQTQDKLVRVIHGKVFDVAVDLRQSSPTFGKWTGIELSAENHYQLFIPEGFAHGFVVLSDEAHFLYKTTDYWHQASEQCLIWNDKNLSIDWQLPKGVSPNLNPKDALGKTWSDAIKFA